MEYFGVLEKDAVIEGESFISGDLLVPKGVRLVIAPGARLQFSARPPRWSCAVFRSAAEGYPIETSQRELADIVVLGRLEAIGTLDRPILIGRESAWGGILCLEQGKIHLEGSELRGFSEAAVQTFDRSELAASECLFEGGRHALIARGLSRALLRKGEINTGDCGVISCEGSSVVLDGTRFSGKAGDCSLEDWSLLKADECRFASQGPYSLLAKHYSCGRINAGAGQAARRPIIVEGKAAVASDGRWLEAGTYA